MTVPGLLPPGMSCSAYWYAQRASMLTGDGDLEFLRCLGLRAWYLARQSGVQGWQVTEGPYLVWMWPEWVWDVASRQLADDAARYGDYGPDPGGPGHGYAEAGDYG